MKKYVCNRCGEESTAEEWNEYTFKMFGIPFTDIEIEDYASIHVCPGCGDTLEKLDIKEIEKYEVTGIQFARTIIKKYGKMSEHLVVERLRALTYNHDSLEAEREAQRVIDKMLEDYTLSTAQKITDDQFQNFDEIDKKYFEGKQY